MALDEIFENGFRVLIALDVSVQSCALESLFVEREETTLPKPSRARRTDRLGHRTGITRLVRDQTNNDSSKQTIAKLSLLRSFIQCHA